MSAVIILVVLILVVGGIIGVVVLFPDSVKEITSMNSTPALSQLTLPGPSFRKLCNNHGKCLSSVDNSSSVGAVLAQKPFINQDGQLWYMEPDGHVVNKHGKYLGNNGNERMVQLERTSDPGQLWSFNDGNLCNGHNKCLAAPANTSDDSHLIHWSRTNEDAQKWSF